MMTNGVGSPISHLDIGALDPEAERHEWLLPGGEYKDAETEPVKAVMMVRDYLDSLPATSASFTRRHVVKYAEDEGHDEFNEAWFPIEIMWLADCWEIPPHFNRGSKRIRWINPQYTHREQYSPVTVSCECGGVVTRIKSNGSGYGVETEHEDDCYPGWQAHAAGILMENRRILLTRFGLLAKSARANHDLLHCEQNQVSHYVRSCGVDTQAMKRRGMEQRNNTIIALARQGYSGPEIGRVYGLSGSRIREVVASDTEYTLSELKP